MDPFVYEGPASIFEQEGGYATYGLGTGKEEVYDDIVLLMLDHFSPGSTAATVEYKKIKITMEVIE